MQTMLDVRLARLAEGMQSVRAPRSMASQGSPRRAAESLEIAMCVRGVGVERVRGAKGVVTAQVDHLCIRPPLEGRRHCPDGSRPRGRSCTRWAASFTVPRLKKVKAFAGLIILYLKRENRREKPARPLRPICGRRGRITDEMHLAL